MMNNAAGEMPPRGSWVAPYRQLGRFAPRLVSPGRATPGHPVPHAGAAPGGVKTHLMPCPRPGHSRAHNDAEHLVESSQETRGKG